MTYKEAYGIDELVKAGPIGRSKLYQAIRSGNLLARKAGRRTIVLRADYQTFLEALPRVGTRAKIGLRADPSHGHINGGDQQ